MAQLAFIPPQMLQPKYWMNTEKRFVFPEKWRLDH